jgi:hypothetical protein
MMKIILILNTLMVTFAGAVGFAAPDLRFPVPDNPMALVTDEAVFRPFAEKVRAEVERLLGEPAAVDDPETFKLLLSTRVHLAHHFADNDVAIATAAWIRSLQTDPTGRAFAGLTTFAAVEARRRHPGLESSAPEYRKAFFQAFAHQLAALPTTPAIVTMLRGQREKIAGISENALLAETQDVILPALKRKGHCGLDEADRLVRVRHRLVSIVPVKDETLRALDAAIASRTSK